MTQTCDQAIFERRLRQALTSGSQALECDQFACLQDFYGVLRGYPGDLTFCGISLPDQDVFEAMLNAQGFESAAMSFLTGECGFMISRGPPGVSMASVILSKQQNEATAEASTPALAVIAAIAIAFLKI